MALFLMAADLRRLARLFLLNSAVEPIEMEPLVGRLWVDRTAVVFRTILVLGFLGMSLHIASEGRKSYGDLSPPAPHSMASGRSRSSRSTARLALHW